MKKLCLPSASVWTMVSQRERYVRRAILALLVGLLVMSGNLARLAPACRAKAGASCAASSHYTAYKGIVKLPPGAASDIRAIPADITDLLPNLPPSLASFLTLALPYAVQAHHALGWQISVILAQWGLEDGWHVPTYTGYNWGNVGPMPGVPTVPGTSDPGSPVAFSYAATPADGTRLYISAARLPYYTHVGEAVPYGALATAVALGNSPWDANHYTNTGRPGSLLLDIMQRYQLLLLDSLLP